METLTDCLNQSQDIGCGMYIVCINIRNQYVCHTSLLAAQK